MPVLSKNNPAGETKKSLPLFYRWSLNVLLLLLKGAEDNPVYSLCIGVSRAGAVVAHHVLPGSTFDALQAYARLVELTIFRVTSTLCLCHGVRSRVDDLVDVYTVVACQRRLNILRPDHFRWAGLFHGTFLSPYW